MQVTDVRVFLADEDRLKGYATLTFDNCFVVRDLKIISGNNGFFVAMPSKKRKDGSHKDIAHPINTKFREEIEKMVIDRYKQELQEVTEDNTMAVENEENSGSVIERKIMRNPDDLAMQDAAQSMPFDSHLMDRESGVGSIETE